MEVKGLESLLFVTNEGTLLYEKRVFDVKPGLHYLISKCLSHFPTSIVDILLKYAIDPFSLERIINYNIRSLIEILQIEANPIYIDTKRNLTYLFIRDIQTNFLHHKTYQIQYNSSLDYLKEARCIYLDRSRMGFDPVDIDSKLRLYMDKVGFDIKSLKPHYN